MSDKKNNAILTLMFFGVLMGALDISIVGPAIPSIEKSLHIDSKFTSWIFSIYVLFNLTGISLFAKLSDIYGRRNIYIISVFLFFIGSLVVSITESFDMLLLGRAIQGFGASGIFPVATALIGDLFPPEKRGRLLGMIGAVFGIAFLLGPFIAGVLLKFSSWNSLFLINLPVCLILIYFSWKILPKATSQLSKQIDWGGIIFMGIALASFVYGINVFNLKNNNISENSTSFIFFIISIVSGILLLVFERKAQHPIIKFSFLYQRNIIITAFIASVVGMVQSCFVFIPKFAVQNYNISSSSASFMLIPLVLATAIGSPVFGRLIDRFGVKRILILGLIFTGIGFFSLSQSGSSKIIFYTAGVFIGLGLSILSGSSLRYIILNSTEAEDRAVSQGMLTIFINIGQLTGAAFIGLALGSMGTLSNPLSLIFIFTGLLLFLSLIISLFYRNLIFASTQK